MYNTIINTDFQLPTAVISNGLQTGNPWSNPNNLLLTDGDVAQSNANNVASDVIVGNFNAANVPSNAVITGIEIELIGAYSGQPTSPPITVTPYFVDDTSGTNVYYPYTTPQTLSITPTNYTLGSSTYLFATSFTPNQINNAKIQLVANGNVYIDAVKINVFYYIPSPVTPLPPSGTSCVDCNSPVQVPAMQLASQFLANDRYAYVYSFSYANNVPVQYTDFGSCGGYVILTFNPGLVQVGETGNFMENAMTALWTTLPNGQVQFDFGVQSDTSTTRGLGFHTPYTADPTLRSNHDANSAVIVADSGPFLGQLLRECQIGVVVSAPIIVSYEGSPIVNPTSNFNFSGMVSVTQDPLNPDQADIYIPGAGGTTPPSIVATGSGTSGNTQVTNLAYTLASSGVNRGSLVQISTQYMGGSNVASVTVGGVSCSQLETSQDSVNDLDSEIWGCIAAPLGTNNVVITLSSAAYITSGGESLVGVDQTTPFGSVGQANGTNTTPILTLTTEYDNSTCIDSLGTALTPILYTPGPGQTVNWTQTANGTTRQGGSSSEPAGTEPDVITMQYSITQFTPWVYCAVEVKGITSEVPPSAGIASINGNTTPAQVIVGAGGTRVSSAGGTTTITSTTSGSPLTTKGDIYTYSTGDARLPVGTNGQILSADNTQATGLKWIPNTGGGAGGGGFAPFSIGQYLANNSGATVIASLCYDTVNTVIYTLINSISGGNNYSIIGWKQDAVSGVWNQVYSIGGFLGGTAGQGQIAINGSTVYLIYNISAGNNKIFTFPLNLASATGPTTINLGASAILDASGFYADGTYLYCFATTISTPHFVQQAVASLAGTPATYTLAGFSITDSFSFFVNSGITTAYMIKNPGSSGFTATTATISGTYPSGGTITETGTYALNWNPEVSGLPFANIPLVYGTSGSNLLTIISYPTGYTDTNGASTVTHINQQAAFLPFAQA